MRRKRAATHLKNKEITELTKAKTELTKAIIELWKAQAEREVGLRSVNDNRRHKAERNHQEYRDIAGTLIAGNPQLRRATRYRLAKKVQMELIKQGRGVVSQPELFGKRFDPKIKFDTRSALQTFLCFK